ncbi:methyltransferase [Nocardia altamirensis]|uniref:methyltransferase n=1 Tax=Nocardia altamirensis TaxID=472158 RepID=UPI000A004FC5|nr:methyltransferase [Nocardia altamirensis]
MFDYHQMQRRISRCARAAKSRNIVLAYSVKTNPDREVLSCVEQAGLKAEAISGAEVSAATAAGFDPSRIVLGGVGKAWPTGSIPGGLMALLDDSPDAFTDSTKAGGGHRFHCLRLRFPGVSSRLGVDTTTDNGRKEVAVALQRAYDSGIAVGLATHQRSSFRLGPDQWLSAVEGLLGDLVQASPKVRSIVSVLDLGGGFTSDGLDALLEGDAGATLLSVVHDLFPNCEKLILEPGRSLVQAYGFVLSRVIGRSSEIEANVDACLAELPWPVPDTRPVHVYRDGAWQSLRGGSGTLAGRTTVETDILASGVNVRDLDVGDIVCFSEAGAYDISMRNWFGSGMALGGDQRSIVATSNTLRGPVSGRQDAGWVKVFDRYVSSAPNGDQIHAVVTELIDPASRHERMPRLSERYAPFFGPQDIPGSRYPLNRLGSFARIDRNYLSSWVDVAKLTQFVTTDNLLVPAEMLVEAISLIGALTYSAEWVDDPETAQDLDNSASARSVLHVNQLMGHEAVAHLLSSLSGSPHILDIGVGRGNTLIPLLDALVSAGTRRVRISLLDISGEQLNKARDRIAHHAHSIGLGIDSFTLIEGNLHELGVSLPARSGEFDLVLSGGTLFHSTEKQRIFDWVRDSLRSGGIFALWDWFAPCWGAPTLQIGNASQDDSRERFITTAEQAVAAAQTWAIGWFGPRGYFNYRAPTWSDLTHELDGELTQFLEGKPFAFVDWLSRTATKYPEPDPVAHYYCIEGYTNVDVYQNHIGLSGFQTLGHYSQEDLRARHVAHAHSVADGYDNTIQIFVLQKQEQK